MGPGESEGSPAGAAVRPYSVRFERALRRAAGWHRDQTRKGSAIPYLTHLVAVAMILDRHGFDEDAQIAGLLHDAHEDAKIPIARIAEEFGPVVAEVVAACSEQKTDASGRDRPWRVRKQEHLDHLGSMPGLAKAVILADKLHNLTSMRADLEDPDLAATLWTKFNAAPEDLFWYQGRMIEGAAAGNPGLAALAAEARAALESVRAAWSGPRNSAAAGH